MRNKVVVLNREDWLNSLISELELLVINVVKSNRCFNLAISGGNTPIPLFKKMAEKFTDSELWQSFAPLINIFWVDERPVSANDTLSNVGNALKYLKNTKVNIFPIHGDSFDLSKEAEAYQRLITEKIRTNENLLPIFDLILLGIGDDGHVASLFPGSSELYENKKWVIANWVPQLSQTRLTLTFPVILASEKIWILSNLQKHVLIESVLDGKIRDLPINYLIDNYNKEIKWFITE